MASEHEKTGKIGLGLVGFGVIGRRHAEAAQQSDLVDFVAVADIAEEPRKAAGEAYPVRIYETTEKLLADEDVQAVIFALPANVRTNLARQALRSGRHVLIEKPPAMSSSELQALLSERRGLVAGCCSGRFRLLPQAREATEIIASGVLGELKVLHVRAARKAPPYPGEHLPPPWRLSHAMNCGGVVANWGVYDLDFLLGICGWTLRPVSVSAASWGVPPQLERWVPSGSDAETHLASLVRFEGGSVLHFERGEYLSEMDSGSWQVVGTKGTLRLQMVPGTQPAVILDQQDDSGVVSKVIEVPDSSYGDFPLLLVNDFANAIARNATPITGLEDALVIQRMIDGMYESARKGVEVAIPTN